MKHMALALMLIAAPALGATRTDTTVAFYHGEPDRTGNYIVPGLNWQSVGAVRRAIRNGTNNRADCLPLPAVERQLDFSTGTLGLWSSNHFVIYYRDGRVPQPGIILLGRVTDDVAIFDRPGPVTVRVERIK